MLKRKGRIFVILSAIAIIASIFLFTSQQTYNNLRGAEVVIGSWHGAYNPGNYIPRNADEERELDWRRRVLSSNGFTMRQVELAQWDDYFEAVQNNMRAGNKSISLYWVSAEWAMSLYKMGFTYPVSDSSVNLRNRVPAAGQATAYNQMIESLFTINRKQYAFAPGVGGESWQGNYVFFNKRLIAEAGFDPEHLYNLQRDNRWTWDTFFEVASRATRGNSFGLPCDDAREVLNAFVYGNNGNFINIDNQGRFQNATGSREFTEAVQFYQRLIREGVMKPRPANAAWDWDFTEFINGNVAMLIGPEWRKGQLPESMRDDYGIVVPPRGPRANRYRMSLTENVLVVPSFFSPQEVDIILRAFDLWMVPVSTNWQDGHYWAFRDRRAVDETVALTRDPRNITFRDYALVPGFPHNEIAQGIFAFTGQPAQYIQQFNQQINNSINAINQLHQ